MISISTCGSHRIWSLNVVVTEGVEHTAKPPQTTKSRLRHAASSPSRPRYTSTTAVLFTIAHNGLRLPPHPGGVLCRLLSYPCELVPPLPEPSRDAAHSPMNHTQVGTGRTSVAEEIAEVQRVLLASGLKYTLHSAGTTVGACFPGPFANTVFWRVGGANALFCRR